MIDTDSPESHLPSRAIAVSLVAAALSLITASANLEVPLYRVYAATAGFGAGLTAIVFAAYVAGLLPVLILLGGISDRIGRKPTMLIGLTCAACATVLMIVSPSVGTLFLARLLQGVGVGLSVGAGTAFLAELFGSVNGATRAANLAVVTTSVGFGSGALLTSITLAVAPMTPPLSYVITAALTAACIVGMTTLRARGAVRGGALLRLPHFPHAMWGYGFAIALAWAVTGLVIAVLPGELARYDLAAWSGPTLFLVNTTGAAMQPFVRRLAPTVALRVGFALLPLGYVLLVLGAWSGVLALVLVGAMLAGAACYGFTYLGGLAAVSVAGGNERARAVSGYFLCAYLGLGVPSIVVGFLADRVGVIAALIGFGIALCVADLALALRLRERAVAPSVVVGASKIR